MENSTIPRTIYNSELTEPTKDILFLTFPGTSQNSELTQTLDNSYAFKGKIYLYRLGNIKKIYIDGFKDIPVGKTTVIDTIPKDYLPIMSDYSWDKNNVSGQPYRIGLLRNGSLSIHVYTSSFSGENNTIFDEVYF